MNSGLAISTLGNLTFGYNGEFLTNFSSRKSEALLVYLAVDNAPHRREILFTLLWPGMPEKSARHNLRQVIYALRQTFSEMANSDGERDVPLLLTDRQTVQINPAALIEVDLHQIDRMLDAVEAHDHLNLAGCEVCIESLEKVGNIYGGDFLADFYLEDSVEFEEWAEANREAYRGKALQTLEKLAEISIQKADFDQASRYAEEQIRIDPLREGAYRQLMELYSKSGQRTEAIRTYQRCSRILELELDTAPSIETTALYEIIRGEDLQRMATIPKEGSIRGYRIHEHLGSGHTGMVYRAFQPVINRDVAVKVIAPQFANHPDFIRRFEVEAQLVARLEHPYIVPLYDYWRDPSGAYLVMRWLKGGSLQDYLKTGPWMPKPAVGLVDQITTALSFAHRQGVVHCDIKPANILLDEENSAYLSDFGIAKLTGPLAQLNQYSDPGEDGSSSGSLGYLSPEVARGQDTTILADVYSLGVVLFELLTARHPFPGLAGEALIQKHLTEPLPSVRLLRAELPETVDEVIQKATEKDPTQRYQEVDQMAQAFRQAIQPETITIQDTATPMLEFRNPYKGLRPFEEADWHDFFGRDQLIQCFLQSLTPGEVTPRERFLAVVGPSGSGKSSVVKAGLIPAIRKGAIPGSESWFIAEMTPGLHPLEELETALLRIAIETPEDLLAQLQDDPRGLLRVLRKTLPGGKEEVLLVIDQFEELFTLVEDESERKYFMKVLGETIRDPHSPVQVLITLRADFYDRPLQQVEFGELIQESTEVVLPLNADEIERAICGPAEVAGIQVEAALVARIVQDVGDQPGTLPLLQYALTETFEQREDRRLTLQAYEASGGVLGALGGRAEEIYNGLGEIEQETTRQLFLRLVTLGEGTEDTRRRVLLSEIEAVLGDSYERSNPVINQYGRYRLLTFDHDSITRTPTVEVAHEALLQEWSRLRNWLDESRDDVRMQRLLAAAMREWQANGREASYLLRGNRLAQFLQWVENSNVALSQDEQVYLDASLSSRREREAEEAERQVYEAALEQRSRRFLWALVGVFAIAAIVAVILSGAAFNQRGIAEQNAATATYAQGEAQVLADSRATQQAIAEEEAAARALAEAQAVDERNKALEAEQEALKQASIGLAAQALTEMQSENSERGVLLALAALEEYPYTPEAEAALGRAVQESLQYKHINYDLMRNQDGHWVDWSPDGARIALGASTLTNGGNSAVVFDFDSGQVDLIIPLVIPDVNSVRTDEMCSVQQINWSPDGTKLALAVNNNLLEEPQNQCYYLQIYDSISGELLLDLDSQGEFAVDWSPDGTKLLTGGENGAVRIWDVDTGEVLLEMVGHQKNGGGVFPDQSDRVLAARFSPDGRQAASFSAGGIVHIWDTTSGELIGTLEHTQAIIADTFMLPGQYKIGLAWSPFGDQLVTGWHDGLARIWDLTTGEIDRLLAGHTNNVIGVDWSPDGTYILTQSLEGAARLWIASTGQMLINLPTVGFGNAAWSQQGDWIAVPVQAGLLAWDIRTLPPVLKPSTPVQQIARDGFWTPDGKSFILSGIDGLVFDWIGDKTSRQIAPSDGFVDFSPDSRFMVAAEGGDRNPPQIIDLHSGEVVMELQNPEPEPFFYFSNCWSHDGARVASSSYPGFWLVIWDPQTGKELARSETVDGFLKQANFSPDDQYIATPCYGCEPEASMYILDSQTGETVRVLPSDSSGSRDSKWSPDGSMLAVSYSGGAIKIWDTDTWTVNKIFDAHGNTVGELNWSPDGRRIVSGDGNSIIFVWEVETGDIVAAWDMQAALGGFQGVKWSPDGDTIAILGMSTPIPIFRRVWQSTEDLIEYAYDCCVRRELTLEEREQFGLLVKE